MTAGSTQSNTADEAAAALATTAITATTRRSFLARAALLGVGIPALGNALAGCGGENEADEKSEEHEREQPSGGAGASTSVVPFKRFDPTLPPLGAGRTQEIQLTARDVTVTISNNVAMRAWTFDGTVPGPILHVRQGDTVHVTLTNEGAVAHSIDLHAARIDIATAFRSIAPGESLSYTFTPQYAGAYLYHCGTAPVLLHIGSGMYGAVIVDPRTPLPPAREFVLVHSAYYLNSGAAGTAERDDDTESNDPTGRGMEVYDPSYQNMLSGFPDHVAFNGHTNQYIAEPITVRRGELVRFYVVNAGPNDDCAFHLVGQIFDTVYLAAPPENAIHGVQTYNVPAGGGKIFEFKADVPGQFQFVNHKFGHGDKGAIGLLIVEP